MYYAAYHISFATALTVSYNFVNIFIINNAENQWIMNKWKNT